MPEARHRRVWIRFSEEEHAALAAKAQAAGMKPSALLRDHLGKVRIRHREDERQRVIALNRINGNLNMLARWCNVHKGGADAVQIMGYLRAVEGEITRLLETLERR
jgi:hypothetical protein